MPSKQESTQNKRSAWLERFLIKDIRTSFLLFFVLIMAANFLLPGSISGLRPTIFWVSLLISLLPWLAYVAKRYSPYRFSVTGLLFATTIVALYTFTLKNTWHLLALKNSLVVMGFCLGSSLLGLLIAILTEQLIFNRPWNISNQRIFKGEGHLLIMPAIIWPIHLCTAFVSAFMVLVGSLGAFDGANFLVGFGFAVALVFHIQAFIATEVKLYQQGIRILGRSWLWQDGSLQLLKLKKITQLGPDWLINEKPWKRRLWPIVPTDKIDEIQQVLDEHHFEQSMD